MTLDAARHLLAAHRPELAERELRRWLAQRPDDAEAHAVLAWCLALQAHPDAAATAEEAVRLAPEWDYTHAVLGDVRLHLGQPREAERAFRDAVALAPDEAGHRALLASALLQQRFRARESLRAAEAGLAIDPGHAGCARVRALALIRLFRYRRARHAAALAQRLDPENAYGHAIVGWTQLVAGSRRRGREHLREALRADPENSYAQAGLRNAERMLRFGVAMDGVLEERPAWLWAGAALHALAVAAAVAWGHRDDTLYFLGLSLYALLHVEVLTRFPRVGRERRARAAELRIPGELTRADRRQAVIGVALAAAAAVAFALLPAVREPPARTGAPRVSHLPWNHQEPPGVPRSDARLRQSLGT